MESKFEINQEVWFINYDKPHKAKILGIGIAKGSFLGIECNSDIIYSFNTFLVKKESELFTTKEELITNLFKDVQ